MIGREEHEMIERYRMHDNKQWRQGFCAALTTTHGRPQMERIRRMGEDRDRGKSDFLYLVAGISDAFRHAARDFVAAFTRKG